jgi:hypothetical protein
MVVAEVVAVEALERAVVGGTMVSAPGAGAASCSSAARAAARIIFRSAASLRAG